MKRRLIVVFAVMLSAACYLLFNAIYREAEKNARETTDDEGLRK